MARKIKETPVLTGKDAASFNKNIKDNETKRVSAASFNRAHDIFNRIGSIK